MNYRETLDFLFGQLAMFSRTGEDAYKPGLDATLMLSEAFGNPHSSFPAIHVGGTNGKGSTAHTLAAVLQSAGYRVGLFTSPHLVDFRERIRVDGKPIPEEEVVDFVDRFLKMPVASEFTPSFFEFTTIMAFEYFARCNVDVAVVEVGLGGRLDSTNILENKLLTVVTNISLDHTSLLGHTEPEIAFEKAGIFAAGVPAVVGNPGSEDVRNVFRAQAEARGAASLIFAVDSLPYSDFEIQDTGILYKSTPFGDIKGELSGDCQTENAATVLHALNILASKIPGINASAVRRGFASVCTLTGLQGRWMTLPAPEGVRAVCDTGHNIGGWRYLGKKLSKIAAASDLIMIIGFVNDKDVSAIMGEMPRRARYLIVEPSIPRARGAESTADEARAAGLEVEKLFAGIDSVKKAYEYAIKNATPGTTVFVGGSTFVVADLLS